MWVGNQPDPEQRLQLEVSDDDLEKIRALPKFQKPLMPQPNVTVTDVRNGKKYVLRRDACGLGCMCALALVRELA